jgi:hypothetical protein
VPKVRDFPESYDDGLDEHMPMVELGGRDGVFLSGGEQCTCRAGLRIEFNGVRCCASMRGRFMHNSAHRIDEGGEIMRAESDGGSLHWCHLTSSSLLPRVINET